MPYEMDQDNTYEVWRINVRFVTDYMYEHIQEQYQSQLYQTAFEIWYSYAPLGT